MDTADTTTGSSKFHQRRHHGVVQQQQQQQQQQKHQQLLGDRQKDGQDLQVHQQDEEAAPAAKKKKKSPLLRYKNRAITTCPTTCKRVILVLAVCTALCCIVIFHASMIYMHVYHRNYKATLDDHTKEISHESDQRFEQQRNELRQQRMKKKVVLRNNQNVGSRNRQETKNPTTTEGVDLVITTKNKMVYMDPLDVGQHDSITRKFHKLDFLLNDSGEDNRSSILSKILPKRQRHHHDTQSDTTTKQPPQHLLPQSQKTQEAPPNRLRVKYLGIVVDAGRHYFDMDWLYRLLDFLPNVGFNMIQFRISDDQAFAIQLNCCHDQVPPHYSSSYPYSSTTPSSISAGEQRQEQPRHQYFYYTPQQISNWVYYAKSKYNITIIP